MSKNAIITFSLKSANTLLGANPIQEEAVKQLAALSLEHSPAPGIIVHVRENGNRLVSLGLVSNHEVALDGTSEAIFHVSAEDALIINETEDSLIEERLSSRLSAALN